MRTPLGAHDARSGQKRAGIAIDGVAIASVLLIAVVIAGYVHHSMGQIRQLLPKEIMEQQQDMSAITHSLGELVHELDIARTYPKPGMSQRSLEFLRATSRLLNSVRQDYTFDSLTGASALHAVVNPAVEDIERWLLNGVSGFDPGSRVVLSLAHQRAAETHDEVLELEARTDALTLSLLTAEVDRLSRLRSSLVALILAFALLALGVAVLYMRQRNAKEHFVVAQGRLTDSLESADHAVALFDAQEHLVMSNQRYRELFALDVPGEGARAPRLTEVVTAALETGQVISVDDSATALADEYLERHEHPGHPFEMQWHDGRSFQVCEQRTNEGGTVVFLTDITDLKSAQRRLEHLATHDALTGLPGRRLFQSRLEEALLRAGQRDGELAVVFVDIDRLKWVNDTYGHVAGDHYLREFATRLRGCVRDHDVVARLGGDEFAVILTDVEGREQVAASAQRALDTVARPQQLGDVRLQTTVSMGIALFPRDGDDAPTLVKNADDACYHAKSSGRANFQFYTDRINLRSARRSAVEHHLRVALQQDELTVSYQPQMCLATRRIVGMEALLRWDDPTLGVVDPAEFVAVAEDSGLGRQLLHHAATQVCRQLREWLDRGIVPVRIWLNVAPRQLVDAVPTIDSAAERFGLDPAMLGIEITERTLVEDPLRTRHVFVEIKRRGVSLAIDDFGVGYSSLSALKDYPLDELKLDASFVRNLDDGGHDVEIVRAIVALAHSLELTVVAEGVETEHQLQVLQAQHVHIVQGNVIGEAVPGQQAEAFLSAEVSASDDLPPGVTSIAGPRPVPGTS